MSGTGRRISVRRGRRMAAAHVGGSWKIALADFMTALMALFLVLWLLATSTTGELRIIAEYFRTPLLVAMAGGDRSTASTSAIPGGGTDPVHTEGEVSRIDLRQLNRRADVEHRFLELAERIRQRILDDPRLRDLQGQLRILETPEGLVIQLLDSERRPMFERGSDVVAPYMSYLLRALAPILNEQPDRISISGHTDSLPYRGGSQGYSNWELSADRANASRRELMAGGLDQQKLVRVVGKADEQPMYGTTADDPINRRIEVLVMKPDAVPGGAALPPRSMLLE